MKAQPVLLTFSTRSWQRAKEAAAAAPLAPKEDVGAYYAPRLKFIHSLLLEEGYYDKTR